MAERDPLTGLYNQRAFNDALERAIDEACPHGDNVSVIVADLDNFKLLNDSYGHQFGDAVLIDVANVFASLNGGAAVAARLGGDEFAVILPGAARAAAVEVARTLGGRIAALRSKEQAATLGSFGIGTYPGDGDNVRALFSAADGRMYSEKHQRKADSLATLAGASRKLFVRAGRAMRPDHSTERILTDIAEAARDEFALLGCAIAIPAVDGHLPVRAVASFPDAQPVFAATLSTERNDPASVPGLPADAWLIDMPVPDEQGGGGRITLVGVPSKSFRPDAPVVIALADLVQAVVANGRAHVDALRAGRERDIHIELARALAGEGTLGDRLSQVTEMVALFVGAMSVSIEGLRTAEATRPPYNLISGANAEFMSRWEQARSLPQSQTFAIEWAERAPCIIGDVPRNESIPVELRHLLERVGVESIAMAPIRFDGELLGLLGAVSRRPDYFGPDSLEVLAGIGDHLAPSIKVALLRDQLEASYAQLEQASRESLARLADAAEARDPHTAGHLRRIGRYSFELAMQLGLPAEDARAIADASAVHDLGKLSLPDDILMKPGKLTSDDWELMRAHPVHGERLIGDSPKFAVERTVARWHHERWDGTGYPDGLAGDAIPLAARIVAVADAFDALTTARPYKPAWSVDEACAEIVRMRGTLFCPTVVGALESVWTSGDLSRAFDAVEREDHDHQEAARAA